MVSKIKYYLWNDETDKYVSLSSNPYMGFLYCDKNESRAAEFSSISECTDFLDSPEFQEKPCPRCGLLWDVDSNGNGILCAMCAGDDHDKLLADLAYWRVQSIRRAEPEM